MNKMVSKFALTAGVLLALAFTFSCSAPDDGEVGGSSSSVGGSQNISSSSADGNGYSDKGNDISNYRTIVNAEKLIIFL